MDSDDLEFYINEDDSISDGGNDNPSVLEADAVYLLMKKDVPISRATRILWLINHLGQIVSLPKLNDQWDWKNSKNDLELLSVVPVDPTPVYWRPESNHLFHYKITNRTKVWFVGHRYKLAVCLDMSPSQSVVDIQRGLLLLDQLTDSFKYALHQIAEPLKIPGSCITIKPYLYVTIIAHTPFFTTPAQQVLIKGVRLSDKNIGSIISIVEKQLRVLEEKISEVTALAHEQIEKQQFENEQLMGALFEEDSAIKPPNIPMVSPDASFINMLRYSMLALSLLPDISLANILVITDGVVCMPDVNILESLLQQLHYDSTSVSFLMIGSSYHPHCNFGFVAYRDILHFISTATLGFYAENYYENGSVKLSSNSVRHKRLFLWTFNSFSINQNGSNFHIKSNEWTTTNDTFHGTKVPVLLTKKQVEDKLNASLIIMLSRRLREGYTLDRLFYENNRLEITLSLPWKTHTYLIYTLMTQWPSVQTLVNFQVSIKAPYESLHDTTCPIKKQLKSAYRQAVVERFWSAIGQLTTADAPMAQHLNTFQTSNVWFMLPESVRNGMPVFTILPNITIETSKRLISANDAAFPKFSSMWQTICQLEHTHWRKWFHMHRISIILHHDQPLPNHLHLANSSGRFTVIQCRQAVAALYGMLSDWASFVLIDNQSYVKFLYRSGEKIPTWFCIIRITSKLPCPVLNLGFVTGTPGQVRNQVCDDLKHELQQLTYSVRANAATNDKDKSSTKSKETSFCCTILVKPLEKILIRYEKMPNDLTTVVFPDGTQPTFDPFAYINTGHIRRISHSHSHSHSQPATPRAPSIQGNALQAAVPTAAALLTTLSRYLHHRRWVWGVSYPSNPQLSHAAVARILNTITKMRLKEGFIFAHCSAGIINMVLEVEMRASLEPLMDESRSTEENLERCIIQYVIFPPHNAVCKKIEPIYDDYTIDSDDEITDYETEAVEELQMVTEVWVEPQFGFVTNCLPERAYLDGEPYNRIAEVIGNIDSKCISSLLTVEHLSFICHNQKRDYRYSTRVSQTSTDLNSYFVEPTIQQTQIFSPSNSVFLTEDCDVALPLVEERIHKKPFAFNLLNIITKCRQAQLLFSTFLEDEYKNNVDCNITTPNLLLLDSLFTHLQQLNDQSLYMRESDSKTFLELVLKREQSGINRNEFRKWLHNDYLEYKIRQNYPLWRCFIKGVSDMHVLLTFIPASIRDLILLNTPANNTTSWSPPTDRSLILPIFVYDCSLNVLIDGFINGSKTLTKNMKDIYIDLTYKNNEIMDEHDKDNEDGLKVKENEKNDEKITLKRACRILISAHSNCFVACTFKSLHLKYHIHNADVQTAVDLCDNYIVNIDITKYIKTVCGHVKSKYTDSIITTAKLFQKNPCYDLRYFHAMIKQKFQRTVGETFRMVPSNTNIYYCSPTEKMNKNLDDSESENWSDLSTNGDSPIPISKEAKKTLNEVICYTDTIDPDLLNEKNTPLFLHFMCTVKGIGSIPIRVLPTCLGKILFDLKHNVDAIKLSELHVTLDIVCSTLPKLEEYVTEESETTRTHTTSIESTSPIQRSSANSESSIHSDLIESSDIIIDPNTLLSFHSQAISALEEEIKWQLRDEIVTALLDKEPVTTDTLEIVTEHITNAARVARPSAQLDLVTLNFVYGPSESLGRFLQEFRKLPVPDYKLNRERDYYYLAKDYPSVSAIDNISRKSRGFTTSEAKRKQYRTEEREKKKILSEVQDLMLDILNEVEMDAENLESNIVKPEMLEIFSIIITEDNDCDPNSDHDWLVELDKRRNILPNFWMIMKICDDVVKVYFHCRFLELHKTQVSAYLAVHRSVISAIKSLCKYINQFLLLQALHDTRTCDRLLEAEEQSRDWGSQPATPVMTRNSSLVRMKSVEDTTITEITNSEQFRGHAAYLEASRKYMPGFFACSVVWETHFTLHPRLKTSNNVRPGLSRGIQALRNVLNKFSVINRNNMFVYRDNSSNVFYLRLHENVNSGGLRNTKTASSSVEDNVGLVTRSPSIASLPIGAPKQLISNNLNSSVMDIRPRVRSFGEKESQEAAASGNIQNTPPDDTITLKVHGITGAGRDVTVELVQVLQNRLDDAVLELLSIMLERNPMCKLTPEDVHFLQKPYCLPDNVLRFSVQSHTASHLESMQYYLQQNLLQFLYTPKYTTNHSHFRDYTELEHVKKDNEKNVFLYNQSAASGSRGIACIAFVFLSNLPKSSRTEMTNNFKLSQTNFEQVVATQAVHPESMGPTFLVVEFRIWQKGRVNIEALSSRLKSAVNHATWDLIMEKQLLIAPLCIPIPPEYEVEEFHLNQSSSTIFSNLMRTVKTGQVSHQPQSLDGIKKGLSLPKTLSDTEIETRNSKTDNTFELGDSGKLHKNYAEIMKPWMQFGVDIRVPSITKYTINLRMSHSLETMLMELQRFIKTHTADITAKAYSEQQLKTHQNSVIYIPYDPRQYTKHCLLVGRNFEQWKASCDLNEINMEILEPKSNKVLQKFKPLYENGVLITRQRLLLISFTYNTMIFYVYNWSKDRIDKLVSYGENLGLWLSARASVFNSIVAQKLGLFHNQPIIRKNLTENNSYMPNVIEAEFVARFPSIGSSGHRQKNEQPETTNTVTNILETFRDTNMSIIGHKVIYSSDPVVRSVQELHQLRQYDRKFIEEQKRLHSMWQSRGATTHIITEPHKIQLLRQQSRVIHYCHSPFLFLPKWRLQSAATRDHSLMPITTSEICERVIANSQNEQWHEELCAIFFQQYKQYLQTLGFIPIQIGGTITGSGTQKTAQDTNSGQTCANVTKTNASYLQKSMLGGILFFELFFSEPFFIAKLYTLECQRIQNKTSRQSMSNFILSFLDETDRIKVMMHVHSFAYDFHLRCVHSYASPDLQKEAKLCAGYHLTNFLDDFMKYYSKGPNYARNLVYAEVLMINNLITPPRQLYDYLLSHEKYYHMSVYSMSIEHEIGRILENALSQNEYVLVQVTSSPSFSYKDSQDRQHTDDLDITLIISYLDPPPKNDTLTTREGSVVTDDQNTLHLKYYLILTSRREIYPKPEVERTLGKFRTVTSTSSNSEFPKIRTRSRLNTDAELNTSLAQEMIEDNSMTLTTSVLSDSQSTDTDKNENLNLNEIFPEFPDNTIPNNDTATNMNLAESSDQEEDISKIPLSHLEIRQESVNYLGYYSSHEQLMQQLIQTCAESTRTKIRNMISRGMVHCRTHLLWNRLVSKPETSQLTYQEFIELRDLTRLERIVDIEPQLETLIARQSIVWFQQFSKILVAKYIDQHRYFVSPDGNVHHYVVLHPRYSGAFMLLSMSINTGQGELYAAYREPAQMEPSDISIEDRQSLINDFINCICFHIWMGMIT